jgi:hypothetical protein
MEWTFVARAKRLAEKANSPGPFVQTRFGSLDRLAWPKGACELTGTRVVYWGDRFAAIVEGHVIHVIDAERADMTKVEVRGLDVEAASVSVTPTALALMVTDGLLAIPFTDLERASAEDRGSEPIVVAVKYPERKKAATLDAKVVWLLESEALVNVFGEKVTQIRVPHKSFGLEKGMKIKFADELWPGTYAFIEVPGRPRQAFNPPREGVIGTAAWQRVVARDPTEGATTSLAKIGNRDDGATLLAQLTDRDDLDTRTILIDLLGDAGEACAATFALLGAGKSVPLKERLHALGPLGHFLKDIEFRGGLPWAAELVLEPPLLLEAVAAAASDVRLAMLETFRQGRGPLDIYQQLVTSRVLVGLRRMDIRTLPFARAIRAAGYSQLVQIWGLPASSKTAIAMLGDAFATVRQVELRLDRKTLRKRLVLLADELAALPAAPREIEIATDRYSEDEIAGAMFRRFASLRCASLTIAGVTMLPDEVRVADNASISVAKIARKR